MARPRVAYQAVTHWTEQAFVEQPELLRPDLEARLEAAGEEVESLLALLEDEHGVRPGTALDIACGVGRHAVALAEQGVETRGVDLVPEYVERARTLAMEHGVAADTAFDVDDMRALDDDGTYDLVVNFWTSFGFFDDETNVRVLEAFHDRLGPGGAVLLELVNKEGLLADFRARDVKESADRLAVEFRDYDPPTSVLRTTRHVFEDAAGGYSHVGEVTFRLRLYTPVELIDRLERVGFGPVAGYADVSGTTLTHDSPRMVIVGLR